MEKLQNNFTTLEQSKRLLAMGIPANTADLYYERHSEIKFERLNIRLNKIELADDFFEKHSLYKPHWSVGRLNEIFKICSDDHVEIYDFDLEGTQIERAMQAFENYVEYNWLDFSKLEDYI
jgi:hypothetical protein